ncbi:hypothetical protein CL634_01055 [bacterium]|nr:hypothetical protein [bacterium]|tara:strand:- start:567 stop:815 length:249 start_codon:yes stop_codon:yes gene_type:complete
MYNQMVKFLKENPHNELAVIWFGRDEADWISNDYTDDIDDPDAPVTDAEWAEIAGRFNDMDWQWVSEQFQEICDDVFKERKT